MSAKKRWSELPQAARTAIVVLGVVEFVMLGAAWRDILSRPADGVNGRKLKWYAVSLINFFGPLAYFKYGRKRSVAIA